MQARSTARPYASAVDVAACRSTLRGGSRSFFAASLVLPKSVREPATGLYAFCRMADDAIDQGDDRPRALADLHMRLDRIYAGNPLDIAADRAFADTVTRYGIPKSFPEALLEGFEWDSISRRYDNVSQLKAYGVRVAGTVGAMMAMVMQVRSPALLARACDLGVAMQLTNIARDVGEDARAGRLYLPLDWLAEAGIDAHRWLRRPVFDARLAAVITRLLQAAEELYGRADVGLANLPSACRPGMYAARLLYAEIGRELERRGLDSVNQRAVVSWQRKARILADAVVAATRAAPAVGSDVLEEARYLVGEAALEKGTLAPLPLESERERNRWPRVEDRVEWLVDLFERLERRERAQWQEANASDGRGSIGSGTLGTAAL
jgi:15-cis-phytoene synthase